MPHFFLQRYDGFSSLPIKDEKKTHICASSCVFYPKRRGYVKLHVLKSAVHLKFVQIRNSGDGLSTMAAWRVGMRIDGEIRRAGANLRGCPLVWVLLDGG